MTLETYFSGSNIFFPQNFHHNYRLLAAGSSRVFQDIIRNNNSPVPVCKNFGKKERHVVCSQSIIRIPMIEPLPDYR